MKSWCNRLSENKATQNPLYSDTVQAPTWLMFDTLEHYGEQVLAVCYTQLWEESAIGGQTPGWLGSKCTITVINVLKHSKH